MPNYVDLDRRYRRLSDQVDAHQSEYDAGRSTWGEEIALSEVLKHRRAVVLGPADAGKTEEFRQWASSARAAGEQAFFVRLEYLLQDGDDPFETGSLDQLSSWKGSGVLGYFLLDSVDEAKLSGHSSFERALRRFKKLIHGHEARSFIALSGRGGEWADDAEGELFHRILPTPPKRRSGANSLVAELPSGSSGASLLPPNPSVAEDVRSNRYALFELSPLDSAQVRTFAVARGCNNVAEFIDALERFDANVAASRPGDVNDLIAKWERDYTLGAWRDVTEFAVTRRLETRQGSAPAPEMSESELRKAVERLAAAATLGTSTRFRLDQTEELIGHPIRELLPDLGEDRRRRVLNQAVFEEPYNGTVRFWHRSGREYLAACWFKRLLETQPRVRTNRILFRRQFGERIVPPRFQGVVAWLATMDAEIARYCAEHHAELLLAGGDPASLPLDVREAAIHSHLRSLGNGSRSNWYDHSGIERMAASDLEPFVAAQLAESDLTTEQQTFLLLLGVRGRYGSLKETAKGIAQNHDEDDYLREIAASLVLDVASGDERVELVRSLLAAEKPTPTGLAALCIENLPREFSFGLYAAYAGVRCLAGKRDAWRVRAALKRFIEETDASSLAAIVETWSRLKLLQSVGDDRHAWSDRREGILSLIETALVRLHSERSNDLQCEACLLGLYLISRSRGKHRTQRNDDNIVELGPPSKDVKHAAFWYLARRERERRGEGVNNIFLRTYCRVALGDGFVGPAAIARSSSRLKPA